MMFRKLIIFLTCFLFSAGLITCGIDEFFFLPEIPEGNVTREFNTDATVTIPNISSEYYASNYVIFYKIYISNHQTVSSTDIGQISPSLVYDYNFFNNIIDPANTTTVTSLNTFRNRNYFELEFEGVEIANILPKNGGILSINFPTSPWENPTASLDSLNGGKKYELRRSKQLTSCKPSLEDNPYLLNTLELRSYENATSLINADVAGRDGDFMDYAYVSMYIVAVGTNPSNFTQIYSKPAHISVFKLSDSN